MFIVSNLKLFCYMGTFKSNLGKISQFSGKTTSVWILGFLLLLGSTQDVETKSFYDLSLPGLHENHTDIENSITTTSTTDYVTATHKNHTHPIKHIELDLTKNPSYVWELKKNDSGTYKFTISKDAKDFKIVVHLKSCDFINEYIELHNDNQPLSWWGCEKTLRNNFIDENTNQGMEARSSSDGTIHPLAYQDNLDKVLITPHLDFETNEKSKRKQRVRAVIVVNLYKDVSEENGCGDKFFDCYRKPCPITCCSDLSHGPPKEKSHRKSTFIFSKAMFTTAFWEKGNPLSRCIPSNLTCDGNPNCGTKESKDEMEQICHEKAFCECQTVCLTWNYVLTSLAIAILFIITPTAIVFALFHRRNVALERARLIRLAHMRMADLRGEFTMDDPINDLPPSYDEVYDTKEPPPCFCKALAMQKEYDLRQQQSPSTSTSDSSSIDLQNREEASSESRTIDFQNSGFQCSCANLNDEEIVRDTPPSYSELRRRESGEKGQEYKQVENEATQASDNQGDLAVTSVKIEDVDLGKEEGV